MGLCKSATTWPDNSRLPVNRCFFSFLPHPLGKFKHLFIGSNAVSFLCFKDVLLGQDNGFGLVKDPCYLAAPGSRYVRVLMMLSTYECCWC